MTFERFSDRVGVYTDAHCRVTEDALLLARFAAFDEQEWACDLGSGNAVIPIWWSRRRPPLHVDAVEREPAFTALAERSVQASGLSDRIRVVAADWTALEGVLPAGRYALVTCNPPYFQANACRPSPDPLRDAARRETARTLPTLFDAASRLLSDDGRFCLCHRPERLCDVLSAAQSTGLVPRRLQWVQTLPHTAPWLFLCECGRTGALHVLPTLVTGQAGDRSPVYLSTTRR